MNSEMHTDRFMCPYGRDCGGCSSTGRSYGETLEEKMKRAEKLLAPYVRPDGITGMDEPYYYRNKVHRVYSYERSGRRERHLCGIYAAGTHRIVPVKSCLIEDRTADAITASVAQLASDFRIQFYNEDMREGLLRHVLVRTAHATGEVMVVLVLSSPVLPGKNAFIKALVKKHPEITTIVINVNSRRTSVILGDRESVAYGRGYIEDILCGKRFRISSSSFYQVNSLQTEVLYNEAVAMAELKGRGRVIDAYCGIGTIGIIASDRAGEVIGVELGRDAVRDAAHNAKINGVKNITFVADDAGAYLSKLAAGEKADVIFMDPPRAGASPEFLAAAAAASPGRIVYISCN
ncbi:MAG: 23S rRNA (uracil(1939)-C(5))-methyltransferase RlmD, partial [Lachnospiraceae bacterium]|nr:23S rRNA (uracil(1939)-C(5))-methyltransferase RlmD [Lachnospiraceae bacterium]